MDLKQAIHYLMNNDKNGSWDEVETVIELKEALETSITQYDKEEETYIFYKSILELVE